MLAKSGFLSVVGLSHFTLGSTKEPYSLPQQPTNNLMFYYAHSLFSVTKILLEVQNKLAAGLAYKGRIVENIAVDNLIYLCQGVLKMKELGLWNNEQGSNWLDGGAPFYCVYKSKDGAFFTVACLEQKFFKNFVQIMKEKKLDDNDYQYLLANMLN
jgi:alpha-methylacyl-CoA racemase